MSDNNHAEFFAHAQGSFLAALLFANSVLSEGTTFESITEGSGATLREVIRYRGDSCWGDVIRSRDGLAVTMIPNVGQLPANAVPRRLVFPIGNWQASLLITTPSAEFVADGGKPFLMRFARMIDAQQQPGSALTIGADDELRLLWQREASAEELNQSKDNEQLSRYLDLELAAQNVSVFTQHPAFDLAGSAFLIDHHGRARPADGESLTRHLARLAAGANRLAPTLSFMRSNDGGYPPTYFVRPFAFTLSLAEDATRAKSEALGASLRFAAKEAGNDLLASYRGYFVVTAGSSDAALAAAWHALQRDWTTAAADFDQPLQVDRRVTRQLGEQFDVEIDLRAEPAAVSAYAEKGQFSILPQEAASSTDEPGHV
ncbi:hypothetical protein [Sphingosinicella sp. BN140058]|uniref:hypothetical protein n=1 Tax=Sphingosinicella sp. BN140058 TaxID=1892855 RepID=UPI001010B59B|nr:hypothetical protein [Sphingosinicella sp. BN140058]QAY80468.1 hypothetical protein ETR14_27915 [Sphingosinicella sp. BN140058]